MEPTIADDASDGAGQLRMLSNAQLDEIEGRALARIEIRAIPESEQVLAALIDNVRKDIPHLIAEIRRLRAENERLQRASAPVVGRGAE